jgi:hypothetical protein
LWSQTWLPPRWLAYFSVVVMRGPPEAGSSDPSEVARANEEFARTAMLGRARMTLGRPYVWQFSSVFDSTIIN